MAAPLTKRSQLGWFLARRARRDAAVRGAARRIRRGANGFLLRSRRTGDRGRQRLSVPSPQSADPNYQQAFLGRPGAIRVDDPRAHQWTPVHHHHGRGRRRGSTGWAGACARGASPFGYPQDHRRRRPEGSPKIISKLRLQVSDPANCAALLAETPPDAGGGVIPDYSAERCTVDRRKQSDDRRVRRGSMQACASSTFAIRTILKRSPTGSHRRRVPLSFPDPAVGHRVSI